MSDKTWHYIKKEKLIFIVLFVLDRKYWYSIVKKIFGHPNWRYLKSLLIYCCCLTCFHRTHWNSITCSYVAAVLRVWPFQAGFWPNLVLSCSSEGPSLWRSWPCPSWTCSSQSSRPSPACLCRAWPSLWISYKRTKKHLEVLK